MKKRKEKKKKPIIPGKILPESAAHITHQAKAIKTSWGIVFFFFRSS
jgi:hypothetical protein